MEGNKAIAERQACEIPGLHEVIYQSNAQNQREQKWFARAARRQVGSCWSSGRSSCYAR